MRRAFVAGLAFVFVALCVRAQSAPPAPDAAATVKTPLEKAAEKTDLTLEKTPAYRLHAKITFHGKLTPFPPAEYTVLWADPNHWRAETRWPDLTAIQVASGDHIWKKDTDVRRVALNNIDLALDFPHVLSAQDVKVSGPQPKTVNSIPAVCFKLLSVTKYSTVSGFDPLLLPVPFPRTWSVTSERDVCLLSENGLPLRIKDSRDEYNFAPGEYRVLGMKRFPGRLMHSYDKGSIEIEVDLLDPLDQASADTIKPPPGAASLPWCRNQKTPRPIAPWAFLSIRGVDAILEVAKDGKVSGVRAFDVHGSPLTDKSKLDALRGLAFYPSICGDKVVESEIFFSFPR
jgi:hypothetical protein